MKRLLLLVLFPTITSAAPFVVADVVTGVTQCRVFFNNQTPVLVPATGTIAGCRYDLAGIPAGSHVVKMTAIAVNDPIWGTQESVQSDPLNFTKPSVPVAPSGLTLTP